MIQSSNDKHARALDLLRQHLSTEAQASLAKAIREETESFLEDSRNWFNVDGRWSAEDLRKRHIAQEVHSRARALADRVSGLLLKETVLARRRAYLRAILGAYRALSGPEGPKEGAKDALMAVLAPERLVLTVDGVPVEVQRPGLKEADFREHTPGGKDHDQDKHGNRGTSGRADLSHIEPPEDIAEMEDIWRGGVADFGDPESAHVVQQLPGYFEYRGEIEDTLRKQLGDEFTMYRAMTEKKFEEWKNGADIGPVGFTFRREVAKAWHKFAPLEGKTMFVVSATVRPEHVIMRGSEAENELVVDGNEISFHTLKRESLREHQAGEHDQKKHGRRGGKIEQPRGNIDTPEFKKWFGKSKVVDEKGEPLVVYHGTTENFDTVNPVLGELGFHLGTATQAGAVVSHAVPDEINDIRRPQVMPLYARITNPFRMRDGGAWGGSILTELEDVLDAKTLRRLERTGVGRKEWGEIRDALRRNGYDGIVYLNRAEGVDSVSEFSKDEIEDMNDDEFLGHFPDAEDSYIVFDPHQIKSVFAKEFNPKSPKISEAAFVEHLKGEHDQKKHGNRGGKIEQASVHINTPAFKKWFKNSKVIDDDGKPLVVYHGTTSVFEKFDLDKSTGEAFWGKGFYFSDTPEDVARNYATMDGADLTSKIDHLANELYENSRYGFEDEKLTREEAEEKARAILSGRAPNTIGVHLSMQKPFVVGKKRRLGMGERRETVLEMEWETDDEGDFVGEPFGSLVDLMDAFREVEGDFEDFDAEKLVGEIHEAAGAESITASDLFDLVSNSEAVIYASNPSTGDPEGAGGVLNHALQAAGYDGVIDREVQRRFGAASKRMNPMEGLDYDTTHYVVFKPQQVKSIFNKGKFNPRSPKISEADYEVIEGVPVGILREAQVEVDGVVVDVLEGDFDEPPEIDAGERRRTARVIIVEDGMVWLVDPENEPYCMVPGGGCEAEESLHEAAVREALEETGLIIQLEGYVADFADDNGVRRYYRARRVGGEPRATDVDGGGGVRVLKVSFDEALKKVTSEYDRAALEKLQPSNMAEAQLREHLPGEHDQKKHGNRGGSVKQGDDEEAMYDGWIDPKGQSHPLSDEPEPLQATHRTWIQNHPDIVNAHGTTHYDFKNYDDDSPYAASLRSVKSMIKAGWIRQASPWEYELHEKRVPALLRYLKDNYADSVGDVTLDIYDDEGKMRSEHRILHNEASLRQGEPKSRGSAAEMFDPEQVERYGKVVGYKSREKLIEMPIRNFLLMAKPGQSDDKERTVKGVLDAGKKFETLPFLSTERTDDGDLRVTGHEGRHRARELLARGYETMPVIIRDRHIRWSEQDDPKDWDYENTWPKRVVSETGNRSLPMFFSQQDAAKPYRS